MKAETIEIVKATAPVIKEHGQAITQRMYEIAFAARPDARHLFTTTWMVNSEEGRKQAGRLAGAVYAMLTRSTLTNWKNLPDRLSTSRIDT
jgi:nitric oxide dioxygenase